MGRPKIELRLQHTTAELQHHYQHAPTAVERRRTQVIWFLANGTPSHEVESLTAYSHPSLLDTIHKYNAHGLDGLKDHRADNPGAPPLLNDAQILLLAQTIRADFKHGVIWNGADVLKWVKRHCQLNLHKPRAYELLAAIGFTLQSPRPRHAQADPGEIAEFKKKSFQTLSKQLQRLLMKSNSGRAMSTASD
jgi:transposase